MRQVCLKHGGFNLISKADLKVIVVTRCHFETRSTFVLLKYRSFNDLANLLKREYLQFLREFFMYPSATELSRDPFVLGVLHMFPLTQYMLRAARQPRDIVGTEAKKVHIPSLLR